MDPTQMGAFPCGDWDPLSLLFTHEDLDLTHGANQMYDEMSFEIPADYISASFGGYTADQTMPGICGSFLNPTQSPNCSSLGGSSQEGSFGSGLSNSFSEYYAEFPMLMEERYFGDSFVPDLMGILAGEGFSQSADDNNNNNNPGSDVPADREASVPAAKRLQPKRKCTKSKSSTGEEDNAGTDVIQNPKKRKPRASEDKGKKNAQPKMKKKLAVAGDDGEDGITIARLEGRSLSTCSSEEGSVSEELRNGESAQNSNETSALNSDGKTARASRGTATDPQSLYARRRRERINERLRILQNLVPNGTKVDISTMLEEAVHYVKFLQLQIKLLSSDELWMYAPIAYNGMDIGLNNQILPPQLL